MLFKDKNGRIIDSKEVDHMELWELIEKGIHSCENVV
jgi:hypothetical protein